ncbi:RHS repeat-associated core domain-containing protein [Caballeronia sp. LP006]|nr:RHS repeat-associated core domain-containing protein [Caballeronia sp. LP006]MDR5826828.1 RHS repeat-associated core domain-containing protein [Caballeronia sp. LP006]
MNSQGQYVDEETGLHYKRNRYYNPSSARFISKDPIGLAGGLNPFQYSPNPVQWVDPLGLTEKCCPCTALATYWPPNDGSLGREKRYLAARIEG